MPSQAAFYELKIFNKDFKIFPYKVMFYRIQKEIIISIIFKLLNKTFKIFKV